MNLGEIKPAPKPGAWSSGRITWRLNAHWFLSLEEACEKLEVWRRRYNEERSHSAIRISPRSSWQNQPVKPDHRTSARRKTPDPSGRASLTVHLVPDSTSKRSHFRGARQSSPLAFKPCQKHQCVPQLGAPVETFGKMLCPFFTQQS